MGARGPKPGFRDAQREQSGRIATQGRPRYSRGNGDPFGKLSPRAKKIWNRIIEATRDSGNIREVAYPELEEFCFLVVEVQDLRQAYADKAASGNWEEANRVDLIRDRKSDRISVIANKYQFPPKFYVEAAESSPAPTGPTPIDRILAS